MYQISCRRRSARSTPSLRVVADLIFVRIRHSPPVAAAATVHLCIRNAEYICSIVVHDKEIIIIGKQNISDATPPFESKWMEKKERPNEWEGKI